MPEYDDTCIFCKIAAGEMGTELLAETEHVVAFKDISPVAPVHILVIPRVHVESVHQLHSDQRDTWGEILEVAQKVATDAGIDEGGYRLVTNAGPDSGQEVPHLHIHVIGGRKLKSIG